MLRALSPLFQYSDSREAWMLRGVGRWVGPVLVPDDEETRPPAPVLFPQSRARRFDRGDGSESTLVGSKKS
jgi:hypothetical protein